MAKSKRARTAAARTTGNGPISHPEPGCCNDPNIELSPESIDRNWGVLPPQAKEFILDGADGMFPLSALINFWSSPQSIESTSGNLAGAICGASWYLALVYLKLRMWKEARSLTINGSFIHQCYNSSIEYIKTVCELGSVVTDPQLTFFSSVAYDQYDRQIWWNHLFGTIFPRNIYTHTQMMTLFANLSSKK